MGWIIGLTISAGWGLLLAFAYAPAAAHKVLKVGAINPEASLDGPWSASFFIALIPVYLSHLLLWFLVKLIFSPAVVEADGFYVASIATTGTMFSIAFLPLSQLVFRRLIKGMVRSAKEELDKEAQT